jgi:phage-related protein
MAKSRFVVCDGSFFEILWGIAYGGGCQARDYYESLEDADRAKALALFKRMADVGKIYDKTKFNKETEKLYAFKPQPHRFFCFFSKGKKIFIVSAYQKQGEKTPLQEIKRAENLRIECMERIAREEERNEKK